MIRSLPCLMLCLAISPTNGKAQSAFSSNFDHSNVTAAAYSGCHDGITATDRSLGHSTAQLEFDTCHSRDFWMPLQFRHQSAGYPGDHRASLRCSDCHTPPAQVVPWPFPAFSPDCAGCPASDYEPDPHCNASVSELRDCAGSCHRSTPAQSGNDNEF